jgi:RNA polymerase sigma-70 factor, ECF subfamily
MVLEQILSAIVRREHGKILAGLIRRCGRLDLAEEALQDAYVKAHDHWPHEGVPNNTAAWLTTVAKNRLIDLMRRDARSAEDSAEILSMLEGESGQNDSEPSAVDVDDDLLRLLFTCCHPALSQPASTALALRTLGGLSTREIARAFVEAEATTAKRLMRAKQKILKARIPYQIPAQADLPERLASVLAVIYFIFNEGYASTTHSDLLRIDLCEEAIRLGRLLVQQLPAFAECHGLLALMKLHHARRTARLSAIGVMIPLEAQDRTLWNDEMIRDGVASLDTALRLRAPGEYQIQAAIASLHAQAKRSEDTDWKQISLLYFALLRVLPTPIVELNAAVALAMTADIESGLAWIARIESAGQLDGYYLLPAAKADLLRRAERPAEAAEAYRAALALVTNPAERAYLQERLISLNH